MSSHRRRSVFDRLVSAREAVARAVATGADPWRVAELRQREQELTEAAADAGPDTGLALEHVVPSARVPAEPWPLEWVDEAGRTRKSGQGGAAS